MAANGTTKPEWLKPYHFQPGQSGNPGGKPKTKPISDAIRWYMSGDPKWETVPERTAKFVMNLFELATSKEKGAAVAAKEIIDRVEGKAIQSIDLSGSPFSGDIMAELRDALKNGK